MANLPYVTAPGNIEKALLGIKAAATPDGVSQDFVKTILKIPGGSGNQINSFLKKIGFVTADGAPSDIYKAFRNSNKSISGRAAAKALKFGYAALYKRNEYMHSLDDKDLKGLLIEETGQEKDSNVVSMILASIKALKKHASFDEKDGGAEESMVKTDLGSGDKVNQQQAGGDGDFDGAARLNLSYTINLNLPASSDVAVFNAIFKSLKENLLSTK